MKTRNKKIIGGFLVVMIIATIGAVFVSAETDETSDTPWFIPIGRGDPCIELTEEQKEELNQKLQERWESEEFDEMLDQRIEHTQQQLEILERVKELRQSEHEYTEEKVRDIISEEFDIELPEDGPILPFGCGRCGRFHNFMEEEDSEDI